MNRQRILSPVKYFITTVAMAVIIICTGCNVNITDSNGDVIDSKQDENHSALSSFKEQEDADADFGGNIEKTGSLELKYANQFAVDYYSQGYAHLRIEGDRDYVLIPTGMPDNNLGIEDAILIHKPCDNIYLAASSAVDLFDSINALDNIKAISTKAEDISVQDAADMVTEGKISYVGKYNGPDYEIIVSKGCSLAIESTMINHSPKIKEELEDFGIPVITEHSSYEEDPLGRFEWIKLYGLLTGREEEAERIFLEEELAVETVVKAIQEKNTDNANVTRVAFFYVSSNGYVNIRKPGDYFCRMINIAGGEYAMADLVPDEENALSTMNIGWEDFYLMARDADILIYNGTIDDSVKSLEGLLSLNKLFGDFKAVKEGRVYCTNRNVYQESSAVGEIITELYGIISEDNTVGREFFFELQ